MPIEKIDDFLNCYFDTLEIKDETIKKSIRNSIINRYNKYKDYCPIVLINNDTDKNFIIRSHNGYYSLEDFLLNRLFQGVRYIESSDRETGNMSEYNWRFRTINIAEDLISSGIMRNSNMPNKNQERFLSTAIDTCLDHELGHALKTQLDDGYQAPLPPRFNMILSILNQSSEIDEKVKLAMPSVLEKMSPDNYYKNLINNLTGIANGKYASMIISPNQLVAGNSKLHSTGIQIVNSYNKSLDLIDEILQQIESMDFFPIHDYLPMKQSIGINGNYINTFDVGYLHIIGYGKVLELLFGIKNTFQATYLDPTPVFESFNKEYQNIAHEVFFNDLPPIINIGETLCKIRRRENDKNYSPNEHEYLQLDLFFAKCYSQMIVKRLDSEESVDVESLLDEIAVIQSRLTTNDDENTRNNLPHNVIFNDLKSQLLQLSKPNNKAK